MTTRRNLFGLLTGAAISPVVAKLSPITTATEIGYLQQHPLLRAVPQPGDLLFDEISGRTLIVGRRSP